MRYPCKILFLESRIFIQLNGRAALCTHRIFVLAFVFPPRNLDSSGLIVPSSTSTTSNLLRGLSAADVVDTKK